MRAARLHAYGSPLVLEDIPRPQPGPGEVVVQVTGAGFCHSDIHVIDGEIQVLPRLPLVLGHENAGLVHEVGAGVLAVRPGDRVLVYGGWGCRRCDLCVTGREQLCETPRWVGLSEHDGGYAEYLRVPHESYLVPLEHLDPGSAAPLTDAALTPYHAIRKAQPYLEPDHPVLTIGVGGLGQYGIELLRLLCGCPVFAVDVSEDKRATAKRLGAAQVLDGGQDAAAEIRELTRGHGVAAAFDFVGSDATLALALAATRTGGKVTQIGLAGGTARLKVLDNVRFEVAFEVSLWGTLKELREVVALAESGRLAPLPVEVLSLDRIQDAYRRVKHGDVAGRLVIRPSA